MIILALDQASKTTGWSIFKDNKLTDFGHFTFEDANIGQRLMNIRNKIKELITTYSPEYVIFEDIQQQNNVANNIQTFKVLAQVYGVISELLTELQIPNSSVLSTVWKSQIGIKGRSRAEQKKNAQLHVIDTYEVKPTQDEADSICIGEYYLKSIRSAWAD